MKISVIIPSFNNSKNLSLNLPKVYSSFIQSNLDFEIIISDDASGDESLKIAKKFAQENNRVKILESDRKINQGFSTNVNKGVTHAGGEIIILLNTDVSPLPDFQVELIKHFEDPLVFAVACLEESLEDGKLTKRGRGIGKWEKGFLVHRAGDLTKKDTLWVSGGSGAFKKDLWQKLGGFDELMNPFYWEDIDLSYRARKAGYKTLFEARSVVAHDHDSGSIKTKYSKTYVKKIAYRNQFIFAWKNSDSSNLLNCFLYLPYHLIAALLRGDVSYFYGFFTALIKIPKIVRSRSSAKKFWKLSDSQATITQ